MTLIEWRDKDDDLVRLHPSGDGTVVEIDPAQADVIRVPADQLAEFVDRLYEAAGRSVVVLERFGMAGPMPDPDAIGITVTDVPGTSVLLHCRNRVHRLTRAEAKYVAIELADAADRAGAWLDPTEVDELANIIDNAEPELRDGFAQETPEDLARVILRAGYRKEVPA